MPHGKFHEHIVRTRSQNRGKILNDKHSNVSSNFELSINNFYSHEEYVNYTLSLYQVSSDVSPAH